MIIFKKTMDKENEFDRTEIYMKSQSVSVPDLLEDFKNFLAACGYAVSFDDEIEFIKKEEQDLDL